MKNESKELLVAWLNDAYAMEHAQIGTLEQYSKDFDAYDEIRVKLEEHLQETKQQKEEVKAAIERLGGSVSQTKVAIGAFIGAVQGVGTGPYKDELVKNLLVLHANEHFEHISYVALADAAATLGEDEIARMCRAIARQEKSMAEWLEKPLQRIVDGVLGYENNAP